MVIRICGRHTEHEQIVACKQVRFENAEAALDEYDHMKALRGAPHIAALHDGLEFNTKTQTLSFFMDYYRGKDLDRQVQMLRGAAERFTESQIVEIGYQIAVALEFCHNMNILHQDMKPMNILLCEPWNPLTQRDVPDLYVADFGMASQVLTLATRVTGGRGTPGYEAPEIRGYQAAFSQKSDVYAFGCILHRLCTLDDPTILDDIKPTDILGDYSIELLTLISSMLSFERDARPTALQVKEQLATIGLKMFPSIIRNSPTCLVCRRSFPSKNQLWKHLKQVGHHKQPNKGISTL
jgi:serine/threonine protein kinase